MKNLSSEDTGGNARQVAPPGDQALHARLLARDPTAPSDLAGAYLDPLLRWALAQFSHADADLVEGATIDALLQVAERPEQYDPSRASLAAYLRIAARGDVQNALRSQQRRAAHHAPLEAVELSQRAGNVSVDVSSDPADLVATGEPLDPRLQAALRDAFDSTEWQVVLLMLDGERRTSVFARILGMDDLPDMDQARAVKQVKDRVQKRLQRLASKVPPRG